MKGSVVRLKKSVEWHAQLTIDQGSGVDKNAP